MMKLAPGVIFSNVLQLAFLFADPKKQKVKSLLSFCAFWDLHYRFLYLKRSPDGEELVPGDDVVVRVGVQVAPLPHGGVHPTLASVFLKYFVFNDFNKDLTPLALS
jgi:hypothetical protein